MYSVLFKLLRTQLVDIMLILLESNLIVPLRPEWRLQLQDPNYRVTVVDMLAALADGMKDATFTVNPVPTYGAAELPPEAGVGRQHHYGDDAVQYHAGD
jgi:hypothetical protein